MCKQLKLEKRGFLGYHPDIKFLPKHVTEKNIHIDTIAPNNTNFTVVFLRYLRLCFSWMTPRKKFNCRGKLLHTHLLLFLYLWDTKYQLPIIKKTFEFLYLSYWMSKLPNYCNCLWEVQYYKKKKSPNLVFHFFYCHNINLHLSISIIVQLFFLCFLKYESFSNCQQ